MLWFWVHPVVMPVEVDCISSKKSEVVTGAKYMKHMDVLKDCYIFLRFMMKHVLIKVNPLKSGCQITVFQYESTEGAHLTMGNVWKVMKDKVYECQSSNTEELKRGMNYS